MKKEKKEVFNNPLGQLDYDGDGRKQTLPGGR